MFSFFLEAKATALVFMKLIVGQVTLTNKQLCADM